MCIVETDNSSADINGSCATCALDLHDTCKLEPLKVNKAACTLDLMVVEPHACMHARMHMPTLAENTVMDLQANVVTVLKITNCQSLSAHILCNII